MSVQRRHIPILPLSLINLLCHDYQRCVVNYDSANYCKDDVPPTLYPEFFHVCIQDLSGYKIGLG